MLCMECGAKAENGYTTSVTDLGNCLLIVEQIREQAKQFTQEISIVNYSSAA